jgi:hypothetical protein
LEKLEQDLSADFNSGAYGIMLDGSFLFGAVSIDAQNSYPEPGSAQWSPVEILRILQGLVTRRMQNPGNETMKAEKVCSAGRIAGQVAVESRADLVRVLEELRAERTCILPNGAIVQSHGVHIFSAISAAFKHAQNAEMDARALNALLFDELDQLYAAFPVLKANESWQGLYQRLQPYRITDASSAGNAGSSNRQFLAYMQGYMEEIVNRAYGSDNEFADPADQALWKQLFLAVDASLIRHAGKLTVLTAANDQDMDLYLRMRMAAHLAGSGRADAAEELLTETAQGIHDGTVRPDIGALMFVEAVFHYIDATTTTALRRFAEDTGSEFVHQYVVAHAARKFLFDARNGKGSVFDAVATVVGSYDPQQEYLPGEYGLYLNAAKILAELSAYPGNQGKLPGACAEKIREISARPAAHNSASAPEAHAESSITETYVRRSPLVAAGLSHTGGLEKNSEQITAQGLATDSGERIMTLFLTETMNFGIIPAIKKNAGRAADVYPAIMAPIHVMGEVHEKTGYIPLELSTQIPYTDSTAHTPSPVSVAALLELLAVQAERKISFTVHEAAVVSIEALEALLQAS